MANMLDEKSSLIYEEKGQDVNVIQKQIPIKTGTGSIVFEIMLWVLGIVPGVVFLVKKVKAGNYLRRLEQKIQHDASTVDNYQKQRLEILKNCAGLLNKAIDLDKDTFSKISQYRSGSNDDNARNKMAEELDTIDNKIQIAFENYPELRAHSAIEKAMRDNYYLQKEITAARDLYNDSIAKWNEAVMSWPTKMIVAAKQGYTTRIPFAISKAEKQAANGTFF